MTKLSNAPLQETIFEIRWELDIDPSVNQEIDSNFSFAQGVLEKLVKEEFPVYVRKIPHGMPEVMLQYQVFHQYWKDKEKWPVLQHGPGIFTINDTDENYDWKKTYFPLIKKGLKWIWEAYGNKFRVTFASLRYIDSVRLKDYNYEGCIKEFVQNNFNLSFENSFNTRGKLKGLHFAQVFELDHGSDMAVILNNGKYRKTDEEALIWQTIITKRAKFTQQELLNWVKEVHKITSDLFKEMIKPEFYDSFRKPFDRRTTDS